MSNTARIAATAANTLTKPLNVEDVFSTYLYTGNGTSQTITNGIDLSGEGGAVIFKSRTTTEDWHTYDTERGTNNRIALNQTTAQYSGASTYGLTAFNSDGFSVGTTGAVNGSGINLASWTFRKAPKFFDVVTYTGTGSAQTISHNLGTTPGFIIVKGYDTAGRSWACYHRSLGYTKRLLLNYTSAEATDTTYWNAEPTDTNFSVGTQQETNLSGTTYVAYLFAHNDGDGDFGPTGDQDIIKCGSINTSTDGTEVNLGWEPQFVIFKRSDTTSDWAVNDTMRGFGPGSWKLLRGNTTAAEAEIGTDFGVTSTGFICSGFGTGNYIYIAIRRGPMAVPESATDVFDVEYSNQNGDGYYANLGAVTDTWLYRVKNTTSNWILRSRLTGANYLHTNLTSAETSQSFSAWDNMNGVGPTGVTAATNTNEYNWVWKRAPNFFDVVAYTGDGSTQTINHNLGVVPEMMWVKMRYDPTFTRGWIVYHKDLGTDSNNVVLHLDTSAATEDGAYFNDERPTDTSFKVVGDAYVNRSGATYIAYLFASLDGVSKVGSYTGNGTSQTIDCGFSSGARFVLIKPTSATGHWAVFDTERGIVAGGDPYLLLNGTNAETTGFDELDPDNSGFIVNNSAGVANVNGVSYIYYAIA